MPGCAAGAPHGRIRRPCDHPGGQRESTKHRRGPATSPGSWDAKEGPREGKTDNARRTVPIIGRLLPELRGHQMRSGRRGADLVFGHTATEPFEPTALRRRALAAWERAGLRPIAPHECRHTAASLMLSAGVDLKAVSEWLGHGSIDTTCDIYGHLLDDARMRAIERVDAFMGGEQSANLRQV